MSPGTIENFLPSTSNMMESTSPTTAEEAETIALKFGQMLFRGELWKQSEFEEFAVQSIKVEP
jgi:hypothetical protein